MQTKLLSFLWIAGSLLWAAAPPQTPAVLKVLDTMHRLDTAAQQKKQARPAERIKFGLTESEINEYAAYALKVTPRPGLNSVKVKVFPQNYLSTFTTVDFDAVERWKPGTIPTLLRPVLSGRKTIWVDYRFAARDGTTTFSVEKAYFGSLRLPAFFVQRLIQTVAARQPEHYDTTKPVPLPFGLRQMWTEGHTILGMN